MEAKLESAVLRTAVTDKRTDLISQKGENAMLWTIILILVILWALGFGLGIGGASVGGLIHLLLVIAVIVLLVQLITGRRPVV